MKKLGKSLSDKELEDMMKQADIEGASHISYIFQCCNEEVRRIIIRRRIRRYDETRWYRWCLSYLLHISGLP